MTIDSRLRGNDVYIPAVVRKQKRYYTDNMDGILLTFVLSMICSAVAVVFIESRRRPKVRRPIDSPLDKPIDISL